MLREIQESVRRIARAIAAALGVEVTISDENYTVVASTRHDMPEGSVAQGRLIRHVFQTKKPELVDRPGFHPLCRGCYQEKSCPETAEIVIPILLDGAVIGDVSLIALNEVQRQRLLKDQRALLEFMHEMVGLVAVKAKEFVTTKQLARSLEELQTIINAVDEGFITTNECGVIVHCNAYAARMLHGRPEEIVGAKLQDVLPTFPVDEVLASDERFIEREIIARRGGKRLHLFVSVYVIQREVAPQSWVIKLRDIGEVRKFVYEMTEQQQQYTFSCIIGSSPALTAVKERAEQFAKSKSPVLIYGESGTGKELFARSIHASSNRAERPFIAVNCAAIPDALLESELFGYEEGAFTGAKRGGKPGKFELANGGTLFLDEVGDLSFHLQAKLLRALQDQQIERVGGVRPFTVDVRIIAATNRNLEELIERKEFREDLYYRLAVLPLFIPPLRQRKTDILELADYFLHKYSREAGKAITGFSAAAEELLLSYSWPGNVRELENAVEYAVNLEQGKFVQVPSLPSRIRESKKPTLTTVFVKNPFSRRQLLDQIKKAQQEDIKLALEKFGYSVQGKEAAARSLGISRATLYRRLKEMKTS